MCIQQSTNEKIISLRNEFAVQSCRQDITNFERVGILIRNIKGIKDQKHGTENIPIIEAAFKACYDDISKHPAEVSLPVKKIIRRCAKQLGCDFK